MSMQAQIREWVDQALHATLDPLFERLEKIENYIKAIEQMDVVPADPAPRGKGPEQQAAKQAATAAVKSAVTEVRQAPATGRPSGRPAPSAKGRNGS